MKKLTVLSVIVASLLLVGCNDDKAVETTPEPVKTETVTEAPKAVEEVKSESLTEKATKVVETVKEKASEVVESTKEKANEVVESTKEKVSEVVESTKEKTNEVVASTKEVASAVVAKTTEIATEAKDAVIEKVEEAKDAVAKVTEVKVPASYAACVACHGKSGELKALGKSAVIAGQTKEELVTKMNGYKAGTLNVAGMGGLMKGQVAKLNDSDIEELAIYISGLK